MRKRRFRYDKKMMTIYAPYAEYMRSIGVPAKSYDEFKDLVDMTMARNLAQRINPKDADITQSYYLTRRVQPTDVRGDWCIKGKCDRCGHEVWIDKTMAKLAFKAKEIHCNECAAEYMDGKSIGQIVAERLKELENER